ncbi:high-potential iron-sulfur protein [Aurantibacter sp.]|uniref:high-potential iron-sulfur protein n=1 Tax=Aurantibacter sp. TaxID=2807103 RepID=UPI003265A111
MTNKDYSRRKFINRCISSGGLFFGGLLLLNCGEKNKSSKIRNDNTKQNSSKDPCNDLTKISDGEIKKRQGLGYVKQSAVPENSCSNCALFIPAKADEKCGGCILFKGPVYAEGHCVQWAAISS